MPDILLELMKLKCSMAKWVKQNLEWSLGCGGQHNQGQCPICHGVSLAWRVGHGGWGKHIGHKKDCRLAQALQEDGFLVVWDQPYYEIKGSKPKMPLNCGKEECLASSKDWLSP